LKTKYVPSFFRLTVSGRNPIFCASFHSLLAQDKRDVKSLSQLWAGFEFIFWPI